MSDHRIYHDIKRATTPTVHYPYKRARTSRPQPLVSALIGREIAGSRPSFSSGTRVDLLTPRFLPRQSKKMFEHDESLYCGQFSQDGEVFMSACKDFQVRLYDANSWRPIKSIHARHVSWAIIDVDHSPDKRWVIYSSWSNYVQLCNVHGDFQIHDALDFIPDAGRFCLFGIKFSPDSRMILGGASGGEMYLYDVDRKERTLRLDAHEDDVNSVCFLDNTGHLVATGSDDNLVKVWDTRLLDDSRTDPVGEFEGHFEGITHVSSKGDGRYLLSNSKDQTIKLWDLRSMHNPNEKRARSRSDRSRMRSYFMHSHQPSSRRRNPRDTSIMTYRGHAVYNTLIRAYFSPAFTTGQQYIYSGDSQGNLFIYDILTGTPALKTRAHRGIIRDLSWHPFRPEIVTTSWDCTVRSWNPTENKE
eukprot:TRINITY_DN802_c2_g1_i2.p1 TRINITY_DN802_c2_g1~~TRINITY_DN802_c2_g1_i2.p1  ORF type:complete len:483 (+),score=133.16 TRINITY_DN802_c2_g1_i2:202-1449(+)